MEYTRIIFERGIEVSDRLNSIRMQSAGRSVGGIVREVGERFAVRPILLSGAVNGFDKRPRERHLVLGTDGEPLGLKVSDIQPPRGLGERLCKSLMTPTLNVQYVTAATLYHVQQMALTYAAIADSVHSSAAVLHPESDRFGFQGQSEVYYEFDALVTAIRRTYDTLRYALWAVYGRGPGLPSNFIKTVEACKRIPEPLRGRLLESWEKFGIKVTAYRDCIQHNHPVTYGIETSDMKRVDGGTWSVHMRIPDDPEVKSRFKFSFASGLDALTYGWEVTNEVLSLATDTFAVFESPEKAMVAVES